MTKNLIQPPRLRARDGGDEDRHATWLELFYDLIFVVAVAQLAGKMGYHVAPASMLAFVALFLPVWWSWIGTTFYATRFIAPDDIIYRLLTMVQMFAVAAIAVNVRDGFGTTAAAFALSYAAVRIVLVIQYVRAGRHIPEARGLTRRFARGFALAAAIWLISVAMPSPARFALWAVGLLVDIGTPLLAGRIHIHLAPDDSHLPERFGQFTLIVLGEAVAAVVGGIGARRVTAAVAIAAAFALLMAFSLAWMYFENLDGSAIQAARAEGRIATYQVWLYTHFPLVVALTAAGVGVEYVVTKSAGAALPNGVRWLICGAVALALVSLGIIHWTSAPPANRAREYARSRLRVITGGLALLLGLLGVRLLPLVIIAALAALCAMQVIVDVLNEAEVPARSVDVGT